MNETDTVQSNIKIATEPNLEDKMKTSSSSTILDIGYDYWNGGGGGNSNYNFNDVSQAIKNNETAVEIVKKFLSAAAKMSERSDSNPVFMMWTIPTTVFALMGILYFVGKCNKL